VQGKRPGAGLALGKRRCDRRASTDLSQAMRNFLKEVRGVFDTFGSWCQVDSTEKAVVP